MGLAKPEPSSVGYTHLDIPKVQYTPPLVDKEEKGTVVDEVTKDVIENGYTQKEALEFMDITETEFLELLIESGNCPSGKLDKNRVYPKELIFEIDPKKWFDPKAYTLEELYGDVVHNTYTLEEALNILEISKSKFKKRSLERGLCTADEFDTTEEFPFEWVWYIDSYY